MKTLVVLVGYPGSGKTYYCEENLRGYTRVSQDDQGKAGHQKTFDKALANGDEFIVVDRVNHLRCQRGNFLAKAKRAGYQTKIIWLNVDRQLCLKRCKERKLHPTLLPAEADQAIAMFVKFFQAPSRGEADEMVILGGRPPWVEVKDLTSEIGSRRHIIVGDVHGCLDELQSLLKEREFNPAEDILISVGDIIDRGPKTKETIECLMGLPRFYAVLGNHDQKLIRFAEGKNVKPSHGLQGTVDCLGDKIQEVAEWMRNFPFIIKTPSGYVVHGGFNPEMSPEEQTHADCIYMRYFGGASYFDSIGGKIWYKEWPQNAPRVFFGHIPDEAGYQTHNIVSLDGGCVFGNYLRAFDSKDGIVYYEKAQKAYSTNSWQQAVDGAASDVLRAREEYVVAGFLRKDETDDGELVIYTYTDQCTYDRAWDEITINSRGHIFNKKTGERVACVFPKFYNVGENESVRAEDLPWDKPYTVTEKVDGWLGILHKHAGKFKVASRGSFHSEGAAWATAQIQQRDLSFLPDEATICFEMINKQQQIILDYGEMSTLIVLAAFNRQTGEE